jgi:hypothetical protein
MKHTNVLEFPSGKSKTNDVHEDGQDLKSKKDINNKNRVKFVSSLKQSA